MKFLMKMGLSLVIIFILISCEKDDNSVTPAAPNNNEPAAVIKDGTYTEDGHNFRHIDIMNTGTEVRLFVVADEPDSYCRYQNVGKLKANPSTGFEPIGDWFKFNPIETWCTGEDYWIVQQTDENTITVKRHATNHETAHDLGETVVYKK